MNRLRRMDKNVISVVTTLDTNACGWVVWKNKLCYRGWTEFADGRIELSGTWFVFNENVHVYLSPNTTPSDPGTETMFVYIGKPNGNIQMIGKNRSIRCPLFTSVSMQIDSFDYVVTFHILPPVVDGEKQRQIRFLKELTSFGFSEENEKLLLGIIEFMEQHKEE